MRAIPAALLMLATLLAGCSEPVWAPEAEVQRAVYTHDAPPSISLITAINNRSREGGHSALMINGSQRVIFDPAGTWWHRTVPERNDVLFGITPTMYDFYIDYHARETYHMVVQTKEVSPEIAELALRRVQEYGAVPKTQCSVAVSRILADIPGFDGIERRLWPHRTMQDFARIAGIREERIYDNSPDENGDLLGNQVMVARDAVAE
jgi:hypothetical protein